MNRVSIWKKWIVAVLIMSLLFTYADLSALAKELDNALEAAWEEETQEEELQEIETERDTQISTEGEQDTEGNSEQETKEETKKEETKTQTQESETADIPRDSEEQTEETEQKTEIETDEDASESEEGETVEDVGVEITEGTCGNNLTWSFDSSTGTLTITGSGDMNDYNYPANVSWCSFREDITNIVFANDSAGKGINYIGDWAFYYCNSLTSVSLPEGLTSIGDYAFDGCRSLTSISLPKGITSIGGSAFSSCSGLTSISLPEGLTSTGDSAFSGCRSLTSVSLPEGLTSIGDSAFSGCSSLTSISLPEGLTSIGDYAFSGCSSLTSISLPEGLTSTGDYAFSRCRSLTSVSLPEGLTSIGDYAFSGCSSLTSISLPENLMSVGIHAFDLCSGLTSISLPKGITSIGGSAFSSCSGLTSISLPEGLTSIGDYAFNGCSSLTSISLPEGLESIGDFAFGNCRGLSGYMLIPASVTDIGGGVFFASSPKRDIYVKNGSMQYTLDSSCDTFDLGGTAPVTVHALKDSTTAQRYPRKGVNCDILFEEWDGRTLPDDFDKSPAPDDPSNERFTLTEQIPNDEFWIMLVRGDGTAVTQKEIKAGNGYFTAQEKRKPLFGMNSLTWHEACDCNMDDDSNIIKAKVNKDSNGHTVTKLNVEVVIGARDDCYTSKVFTCAGGGSAYMVVSDGGAASIDSVLAVDGEGNEVDLAKSFGTFYRNSSKSCPMEITVSNASPTRYELVMIDDSNKEVLLQEFSDPKNVSYDFGILKEDNPLLFIKAFRGEAELCRAIVRVTVRNNKPDLSGSTLELGSGVTITLPDDIPVMGGSEMEFDLGVEIPVKVERCLNDDGEQVLKISGMLGKKEWPEDDGGDGLDFDSFKDKAKKSYTNMKKSDFEKKKIAGFSAEVEAAVYLEGRYNGSEKKVKMDAAFYLEITAESGVTYSTLIGPVPVYVGISGEITDEATLTDAQFEVIFDGAESGVRFPNKLEFENELTAAVKPKAGVGLNDLLSLEVEGKGAFVWGLTLENQKKARNTIDLTFGIGLNAKAFIFSYSINLAEKTFHLYPNDDSYQQRSISTLMASLYDEDSYSVMQRDYILEGDSGADVTAYAAGDGASANVLVNGMYPDAQPKFISYGGTDYLFYLEDQTSRAVEDKSALVYRVNTGNGWSSAKVVNDDGTADFGYDVAAGSDGLYIAWLNAADSLAGVTEMSQMMEHITLSAARLSGDGQIRMLDMPKTEEQMPPMAVSLAADNSKVWIYWYTNTENDLLNNCNGRNIVYMAEAGSGISQKLAELDEGIMTFDSGLLDGQPYAAVTTDTDGRADTIDDREICLLGSEGVRAVTDNSVLDSNPQFGIIGGEQALIYYSEGNLMRYNGADTVPFFDGGEAYVESDDFELVCDGSNAVIIWPETYADAEKMGHSIAMSAFRNGRWTKPSNVAQIDDTLIDFTAKVKDNSGAQLYYTARGKVNGQDIIRLYEAEAKEIGKARFRGVLCDTERYQPGVALPVEITLENTGNCGISECSIFIENSKGERVYTMDSISAPAAGETGTFTVPDFKPADTGDLENYTVKLVCDGNVCDEELLEIGGAEFTLGYRTEYRDGLSDEELLFMTVSNDSNFAGDVKLTICGGESKTTLYEYVSENLQPDCSASVVCSLTELWEKTQDTYVTLRAESLGRKEAYLIDNSINIYNYERLRNEVSVVIKQQDVRLKAGDILQLETQIYAEDGADTSLTWESRDKEYATVNGNGLVTAVKPGITVITAQTVDGNLASCTVTVDGENKPLLPEDTHTIAYYDGAQQIVMEPSVFSEKEAVLLLAPYKTGYDFAGWYETPDFSGDVIEWIPEGTTTDKVFYAKWAERVREKNDTKTETSLSVEFAGTGIYTYTGAAVKPKVIVRDEGQILRQGRDYTVSYKNNTQAATAVSTIAQQGIAPFVDSSKAPMVLITGKGNYKGKKAAAMNFTIRAKELSDTSIVLTCENSMPLKVAKGGYADQQLAAVVKDGKKSLNKAKDYFITYDYLGEHGDQTPTGADKDMTAVNKPGVYMVYISARIAKDSSGRMIRSTAKNNASNANYAGNIEPFILYVQDSAKILSKAKITLANTKGIQQGIADITLEQVLKSITFGSGKNAEVYATDTVEKMAAFAEKFDVAGLDTLTAKAGTGYITVTAKAGSGYFGSKRVAVKILGTPLSKAVFTQTGNSTAFTYNGIVQAPAYTLQTSGTSPATLTEGKDYTITYQKEKTTVLSPVAAGSYTATYTGIGAYTGTVKKTFKIAPLDLAAAYKTDKNAITVTASSAPYNPKGAVPAEVTVTYTPAGGTALTLAAEDYTITCSQNKVIGKGSITLNAKGNYKGTIKNIMTYDIVAKSMASDDITVEVEDVFYKAGADIAPKLTVYDNGVKVNAKDYTVAFADGSAKLTGYQLPAGAEYADIDLTVTANAGKNYTEGTKASAKLHIYTKKISNATVVLAPNDKDNNYYYTGQQIKPALQSVTYQESKNAQKIALANSETEGYLVKYGTNTKTGSASVTIYGTGKYGGSKTVKFIIYPKWMKWMFG